MIATPQSSDAAWSVTGARKLISSFIAAQAAAT